MSNAVKMVAYGVLALCVLWFGYGFYRNYSQIMAPPPKDPLAPAPAVSAGDSGTFQSKKMAGMMTHGAALFIVVVGLALLTAHDLTHYFADRAEELIFSDEGEPFKDPEYERAEQVWADGRALEAIQLMRDYLEQHPREQHVALRIAEIYERDLGNPLAAALEYEEILTKPLPEERWGWAAIHLANIYSGKLKKTKQAEALLHRIIDEYGQTAAAKKARERLGIPEPEETAVANPEESGAEGSTPDDPAPGPSTSNLPPGFRPKKS